MGGNLEPEIERLLRDAGWRFERHGKGSHKIWVNPKTGFHVTVPAGCSNRHTANGILKDAGLPKAF